MVMPISTLMLPSDYSSVSFVFNDNWTFVYVKDQIGIAMVKTCLGQKSGPNCSIYTCADSHCSDCSVNAQICSVC